jgi:hypothetical protein
MALATDISYYSSCVAQLLMIISYCKPISSSRKGGRQKDLLRETSNGESRNLGEVARDLRDVKAVLETIEAKTLSGVALVLSEAVEHLSRTAKDLTDTQPTEWMTAEQAATYLGCDSVGAFEKIVAREEVPKYYLSARAPRYNRAELDAWLMSRQGAPRR